MKQSTYSESIWMFSRRSQSDNLLLVLPVVEKIDQAAEVNSRKDNCKNCWIINRMNSNCRKAAVSDTAGTTGHQSKSRRVKFNRLGCTNIHQLGVNGLKTHQLGNSHQPGTNYPKDKPLESTTLLNTSLENLYLTSSDQSSVTSSVLP